MVEVPVPCANCGAEFVDEEAILCPDCQPVEEEDEDE